MKFLLFISAIVMVFVTGEAIKCFDSYLFDEAFDGSKAALKECDHGYDVCKLVITKLANGSEISQRYCDWNEIVILPEKSLSPPRFSNMTIKSSCHYLCDTDECNSAKSISSNSIIIFLSLTSILMAIKNLY